MKKTIKTLLSVSILVALSATNLFASTTSHEAALGQLTEKLGYLEMTPSSSRSTSTQKDLINQIEHLGAEVYDFNDLPNNDPLKLHIEKSTPTKGIATAAAPNWSSTSKTKIVKTTNTYSGKNFITYECIPLNGHPWVKNYSDLSVTASKISASDVIQVYADKAIAEVISLGGLTRFLPYELIGYNKTQVSSFNKVSLSATQNTYIKYVFKETSTNNWDLVGAANKMLLAYSFKFQGVTNSGTPFVKTTTEQKVGSVTSHYNSLASYVKSASTIKTENASSISIKNSSTSYTIKTFSGNFTTVPASAIY